MIIVGSAVPALLWGVAFANIVQGVPLDAGHNYTGTLFDLLNPYALLGGLTTLLLFFTHGVVFVSLKTEGDLRERARRLAARSGLVTIVVAAAFLVWTGPGLRHARGSGSSRRSRPLALIGGWLANARGAEGTAFTLLAVTVAAAVFALFAVAVPRRDARIERPGEQPHDRERVEHAVHAHGHELDWRSSSSRSCSLYQGWTYWVFRKRVTRASIEAAAH